MRSEKEIREYLEWLQLGFDKGYYFGIKDAWTERVGMHRALKWVLGEE